MCRHATDSALRAGSIFRRLALKLRFSSSSLFCRDFAVQIRSENATIHVSMCHKRSGSAHFEKDFEISVIGYFEAFPWKTKTELRTAIFSECSETVPVGAFLFRGAL